MFCAVFFLSFSILLKNSSITYSAMKTHVNPSELTGFLNYFLENVITHYYEFSNLYSIHLHTFTVLEERVMPPALTALYSGKHVNQLE